METADYRQALELYRKNYLEFKVTGNSAYKTAYENAEKWMQLYLKNLEKRAASDQEFVSTFLQDYARTNPELDTMQTKIKEIQQKGPELQNQYDTALRLREKEEQVDSTALYLKVVAIAGLMGIAAAVGSF